jgi:hypothetical protein
VQGVANAPPVFVYLKIGFLGVGRLLSGRETNKRIEIFLNDYLDGLHEISKWKAD